MLVGEYQYILDPKYRCMLPQKFRDTLGESFMITKGLDNCLSVYHFNEWSVLETKIKDRPMIQGKDIKRFFFGGAVEVTPDKQGRILIPQPLREYAGLSRDVVVVGVSDRAEIWDLAKWKEQNDAMTPEKISELMEQSGV